MNLLDGSDDLQTNDRAEIEAKWKDKPIEELLKAKVESDLYIKTLEKQKDELRTDYLKQRDELLAKAKFEELLDRFEKAPDKSLSSDTHAKEVESPKYDPKEVENMILRKMQETDLLKEQTRNFNMVEDKLKERFGDNFKSVLKEQQSTLGLSTDDVNNLAMKSPEAFFRIMGLNDQKKESFQAPPRSNQRSDIFKPKVQVRDYAYYQELKKVNPKLYLDKNIAVQMHNDVIEMGESRFYGQS